VDNEPSLAALFIGLGFFFPLVLVFGFFCYLSFWGWNLALQAHFRPALYSTELFLQPQIAIFVLYEIAFVRSAENVKDCYMCSPV
jgi:hypothetical protein